MNFLWGYDIFIIKPFNVRRVIMKIVNIMNFVRTFEPRDAETEAKLFDTAKAQLRLCNEMGLEATFLLEYDALCDERYVELFRREAKENIELGLWYEIVEPLTSDIGIAYNSARGYRWDWNIDPGYPMSYPNETKARLIRQAMEKFREIFGYYPRTVGSWVIDTYTMNYLNENYELDALAICRDQINTDAYTMVGGYFSGLYLPSRLNIFTPAQTRENQAKTPVIRLLGADPIHNYDSDKYMSEVQPDYTVYTLEPACPAGRDPVAINWFFRTYYDNENLGMGYTQVGQENSFARFDLITPLRLQFEILGKKGIKFEKMSDTGAAFKLNHAVTPPAAVSATENWDVTDTQSVIYSSRFYTASIIRHEGTVALRYLYLFDDRIEDTYLTKRCDTFDSVHENMPIVDTYYQRGDTDGGWGIILDTGADKITSCKTGEGEITVSWGKGSVIFGESDITVINCDSYFKPQMSSTEIKSCKDRLVYSYKGHSYALTVDGGEISAGDGEFRFVGERIRLIPTKL